MHGYRLSQFPHSSPAVVTVAQGVADNLANNALLQLAAIVVAAIIPTIVIATSTPVNQFNN